MPADNIEFDKVKIKQEKLTPPPEDKKIEKTSSNDILNDLLPSLFASNNSTNGPKPNNESEDKKQIEKLKSSNEILAELFKVFNAAPPKTLLNNEFLIENEKLKKHKKHKKQKKKSKKKEKISSDSESDNDDKQSIKSDKHKKYKKKKKKSKKSSEENTIKIKIKKEKEKEKSIEKYSDDNFSISDYEDDELKGNLSVTIKTEKSTDSKYKNSSPKKFKNLSGTRKISIKNLTDSKILKDIALQNSKEKDVYKNKKSTAKSDSEISLSDEETYLKESSGTNPFYSVEDSQPSSKNKRREFFDDKNYSRRDGSDYDGKRRRYEDSSRDRWRKRNWDQHDRRTRSRSRSRKRSRSRDLGIDKKRLLEIARKNAIQMFKQGSLPGTNSMSQDIKDKVLLKMRYGGKTVEDLTDFCKKLSNGENLGDLSDMSNADSDHDRDGNEKAFHHPFVLKDRGPIVMNIKNAIPIVPKTAEQTKTLLMQFPVSSGQHHRANESEWVPVPPSKTSENKTSLAIAAPPFKTSAQKNIFAKPLPPEQQQLPAFVPVPVSEISTTIEPMEVLEEITAPIPKSIAPVSIAPPPIAPPPIAPPSIAPPPIAIPPLVPPPMIPVSIIESTTVINSRTNDQFIEHQQIPSADNIFASSNFNIDVSSVITKRLNAMRRLQENPMDSEAMKMMYNAQKDMSAWASSKHVPGQFTGSTGVNALSVKELNAGTQAWAKRDTLTSTTPVSGGMGMHLLQKMGWKPGEGLGRERNGALQPLLLEVKLDKKGLLANEEDPVKRRQIIQQQQMINRKRKVENSIAKAQESLESKHPVSLLGELASKRKWLPPIYELVEESGLSHSRTFIFKVIVNDVIYQPAIISNTKKQAKALAAKYCLQQMGILPT